MKTQGKVLALFKAIKGHDGRIESDSITVDPQGIVGDRYYGKNPNRTILITSEEASYFLAHDHGIEMPYGALGENIVVDLKLYHLSSGARLKIGSALLEITQNCTLCSSLGKVDKKLPELLKDDRGIFARTIQSGDIRKGDRVILL